MARSVTGAWSSITFEPASRSRRLARQLLTGLAERLVAHPGIADFLRRRLAKFPRLRNRLRTALRNERRDRLGYLPAHLLVPPGAISEADLDDEIEGVRELYRRLVSIRQQAPDR